MQPMHCRLSVILAREASKAVIFRKGGDWVQIILWHTDTDTFETGQWFHGKLFHTWSDLSPDGSKLIYCVSKHYILKTVDPEYTAFWTAISKPPYLTALALWPGAGGGYFVDDNTVFLWTGISNLPHQKHIPPSSLNVLTESRLSGWGTQRPYIPQLERNGWINIQKADKINPISFPVGNTYSLPETWQKDNGEYRITMRKLGLNFQPYGRMFDYTLQHIDCGIEIKIDTDNWADWDQQGRLVYVNQGRIVVGEINNTTITPQILGDFNANKRERIISPDWARIWND